MTLRPNVSKGCWKNSSDRLTVAQGDHKPLILRLKQNKQKPKQGVSRSACDYLTLKNTRLVFFSSVVSVVSTFCCAIKLLFLTFFIQQYALKICPCCSLLGMYSARSAILTMNSASLPSSHPLPAQRGNLSCLLHTEGCNQGPFLWPPWGAKMCVCGVGGDWVPSPTAQCETSCHLSPSQTQGIRTPRFPQLSQHFYSTAHLLQNPHIIIFAFPPLNY